MYMISYYLWSPEEIGFCGNLLWSASQYLECMCLKR